jgi:transglutaminase-like putative cysteine protease
MAGGQAWSALLVILLTFTIARSTVTEGWVRGIDTITVIALGAAFLMGILALLPIPWPPALGLGTVGGAAVSLYATWPLMHAMHHDDVLGPKLLSMWWGRISDGSAATDQSFYLLLISVLMWVTGGWLSWCVLRWRKPLLGLIPGAAAFATNLLNIPDNQNGYTFAMLVLTPALLLWTNYMGSIDSAHRANVKLTGDARWDFWESGLVATAALILLAILLPPLSSEDRTTDVENSLFSNWAQLQQRINHAGVTGPGRGGIGTTGFTTDVRLSGALLRTKDPVFTYTVPPSFTGPRYFRGVDVTETSNGEWRYIPATSLQRTLDKNAEPRYAEDYQKLGLWVFDVNMKRPPRGNEDIIFYPGQFFASDRVTSASQVEMRFGQIIALWTVDRVSSLKPTSSFGPYKVLVGTSAATIDELRAADTNYKEWLNPYKSLPPYGRYRDPLVQKKIHDLAEKIVTDAGAVNPYDKASAIEAYLRSDKFHYTLQPQTAPPGRDLIDYFLFDSHTGYCEYFATAMGDMLRSLGIPARLVNGYGPGNPDPAANGVYVVRGEDAHTWVEVYFPGFGWIPFEPTKDSDNIYQSIQRSTSGGAPCIRENGCAGPGDSADSGAGAVAPPVKNPKETDPGQLPGGLIVRIPDASTLSTVLGVLVALLLLLLAAASRYLRPRTVMGVWNRMLVLAHLAGAERRPGETPRELSRRLQETFPEASEPVGSLASAFAVAAYAPPEVASTARSTVMESWSALRPMLLRRVFRRLRPR